MAILEQEITGVESVRARAQMRMLPDGRRLHLHDGPIDLIIEAFADGAGFGNGTIPSVQLETAKETAKDAVLVPEIREAYRAAASRFATILDELCDELPLLRQPVKPGGARPHGVVAKRMLAAVLPHSRNNFITPMAAVAGAVAEEVLHAVTNAATLSRAYVNNGGDIALHLARGEHFMIGMVDRPDRPSLFGELEIHSPQPIRGIATSGWRGRSFSLGIADAVTVLALNAATADAAATIIANAVDLPGHPFVTRVPANQLDPDTDLGDRLVTQNVGQLSASEISAALVAGVAVAYTLRSQGLIHSAALHLLGETRVVGTGLEPVARKLRFPAPQEMHFTAP